MAKIVMPDGQSFSLEDEMAETDEGLRAALKVAYPDAANATFTREGGKDDKPLVIKVAKKAGTKGVEGGKLNSIAVDLLASPEYTNEAALMAARLDQLAAGGNLDWELARQMENEIAAAAKAGSEAVDEVSTARKSLLAADASASAMVPMGF